MVKTTLKKETTITVPRITHEPENEIAKKAMNATDTPTEYDEEERKEYFQSKIDREITNALENPEDALRRATEEWKKIKSKKEQNVKEMGNILSQLKGIDDAKAVAEMEGRKADEYLDYLNRSEKRRTATAHLTSVGAKFGGRRRYTKKHKKHLRKSHKRHLRKSHKRHRRR